MIIGPTWKSVLQQEYRVYLPTSTFFPTLMASGTLDFVATVNVTGNSDEEYKQNFIKTVLVPGNYRPLKSSELTRLQGFPVTFIDNNIAMILSSLISIRC